MDYSYLGGFIICGGGFTLVCLGLRWIFQGRVSDSSTGMNSFDNNASSDLEWDKSEDNNPLSLRFNGGNACDK
jgi:hypothetical protein